MNEQREGSPSASAQISDAAVRLVRDYTGRGPPRAHTTINHNSVMILLGDTLTKGERKLVEGGRQQSVLQLRHDFQMVMRDDLVGAVEGATDRKVVAFMSQNHINPDLAVEVFVLEPEGPSEDGAVPA